MRIIPTTKTAVEKLRTRAREIQRTSNISYAKSRDRAAQEAGYDDWRHVQQSAKSAESTPQLSQAHASKLPVRELSDAQARQLYMQLMKQNGSAKVTPLSPPARGDIFHSVEIEGVRFDGLISGGFLYLLRKRSPMDPWFVQDSSVHLGVGQICKTDERHAGAGNLMWYVCKYGPMEPCVFIDGMSNEGRLALAYEFGITSREDLHQMHDDMPLLVRRMAIDERLFYLSPAFQGLVKWCQAHPRKSRTMECHPHYLGDWKSAALAGHWSDEADDDVSDEELEKELWGSAGRSGGSPSLR